MDPELNQPGNPPPQGAPAGGLSDEEYQNQASQMYAEHKKKPQPVEQPATKPETGKLSQFFHNVMNDPANAGQVQAAIGAGQSVARGLVNFGRRTADTLNALNDVNNAGGKAVHALVAGDTPAPKEQNFVEQWMNTPLLNDKPMTDGEVDAMLGAKHTGVLGAVEDITQFSAGVVLAGELGVGEAVGSKAVEAASNLPRFAKAATFLAKGVKGAVDVGLGAAIATDPYEHRLSSIVAHGPSWISEPVKAFLVSNPETDGPIVARLKSGLENSLTAFAIDRFIAGIVSLRASKAATTPAEKEAAQKLSDVKYDPAVHGPIQVRPVGDGTHVLSVDESQAALKSMSENGFASKPNGSVELPNSEAGKVPTVQAVKYAKAQLGEAEFRKRAETEILKRGVKGDVDGEKAAIEEVARRTFHDTIGADRRNLTSEGIRLRAGFDKMLANDSPEAILADRRRALIDALRNPVYATQSEAESVGASINGAFRNAQLPKGELTESQIQKLGEIKARVTSGEAVTSPADLVLSHDPAFDFSYTATSEESAQTVAQITRTLPRTVQTHAETVAQAEGLLAGKSGEEVIRMMRVANIAAEDHAGTVHAGDLFLKRQGETIVKLGRALDANPDNGVAADELRKAVEHLVGVYTNGDSFISSIGRALNAKKIATDGTAFEGHEVMKATGEFIDNFKGWGKEDFLAFARQIGNTEGGAQSILDLMKAQKMAAEARVKPVSLARKIMDIVNGIRMNAMLWGPLTHVTTLASNTMTTVQRPVELWWGGVNLNAKGLIAGEGWGQGSAMQQEGADMVAGVFLELKDALKAGRRAFAAGANVLDAGNGIIEDAATTVGKGPINGIVKFAKLPERLLMTNDEIFKTLGYRSYVRAQSLRLSRSQGITDTAELGQRLAADMKAAFTADGAATNPDALKWGRVATQQTPLVPGSPGQRYQSAVQAFPALRVVTPFVRTPVNLFNYAWDRTPVLNLLQKGIREDLAAGGERAALAVAKTQMGMVMWGGAAMLAYDKTVTGGGPLDPELRRQWIAAGHAPYSIKVPGVGWVSYARGNPVFTVVGIVADLVEMSGELPSGAFQEHAAMFVASIASNVTNQTFMQGLSDTLDAAADKSGRAATKLLYSLETSFIPNITRQINPDNTVRETRGAIDELKSRVPGLSKTLEPRRNILGEPVMKGPGLAQRALNPFTVLKPVDSQSIQEQMVSMGKAMAMPSEKVGKTNLTDRELYDNGTHQSPYDRMQQIVSESKDGNPNLRTALTDLMKSKAWKTMTSGTEAYPGGERYKMASHLISAYQDRAFKQVRIEYPKLDAELRGVRFDKKAAVHTPAGQSPEPRPQFLSQ